MDMSYFDARLNRRIYNGMYSVMRRGRESPLLDYRFRIKSNPSSISTDPTYHSPSSLYFLQILHSTPWSVTIFTSPTAFFPIRSYNRPALIDSPITV